MFKFSQENFISRHVVSDETRFPFNDKVDSQSLPSCLASTSVFPVLSFMFSNFFFLKHIQFLLMALPYPPLGVLLHLLLIPKFLLPTNQICLIQFPISPLVSSSETICPTSALPSQSYNIHLVVAGAKKKAYYKPKVLLAYLTNKEPSFRRLWFMKMAYSSL